MNPNYSLEEPGRVKLLSNTISFLRFPLAVLVVFLHADYSIYAYETLGLTDIQLTYPIYSMVSWVMSHYIAYTAVPIFFIISVFLLFYNVPDYNFNSYKQKIQKRVKSLLVPYLTWNMLYLVAFAIIGHDNIILTEVPNILDSKTILDFFRLYFLDL